jgi:hypothetical protein
MHSASTKSPRRHHHGPSVTLAAATCLLALAACGSFGKPSTAAASGGSPQAIKFADCMRSHGVPNFPDPAASGYVQIGSPDSGINPRSPAFQSAGQACAKLQPGGNGAPHTSESGRLAAIAFAKCMRNHGLPSFPDPKLSSPGGSPTLVLGGLEFPVGAGLNPQSPAFKQAETACGLRIP